MLKRIRKEKFRKKILLYILFILLFFLGNAYSILKQDLTLSGTVTIPAQTTVSIPLEAKARVESLWFLGNRLYVTITNNTGEAIAGWTAIISTPNITGLQDIVTATDINSYCTLDTTNDIITIVMPEDAEYRKNSKWRKY